MLALPQIARTFKQYRHFLIGRANFLLGLRSCRVMPKADEASALSQLQEKWTDVLQPRTLQPLLQRWKSTEAANVAQGTNRWGGMINVLRRQNSWERQRSNKSLLDEEDNSPAGDGLTPISKATPVALTAAECARYVNEGVAAPYTLLGQLLRRRAARAAYRAFGLNALATLLSVVDLPGVHVDGLVRLRPALRGDISGEEVRAPWLLRHCYMNHLDACDAKTLDAVQAAFITLYTRMTDLLTRASAVGDPCLGQMVLWTWGCDVEPRDHEFLLRVGLLPELQKLMGLETLGKSAARRLDEAVEAESKAELVTVVVDKAPLGIMVNKNPCGVGCTVSSISMPERFKGVRLGDRVRSIAGEAVDQSPWSDIKRAVRGAAQMLRAGAAVQFEFEPIPEAARGWKKLAMADVRQGFARGVVTKRGLITHMKCAPAGMVSAKWWREHRLDGTTWEAAARHTVTSLLVAYDSFGDEVTVEENAEDLVTSIRSRGSDPYVGCTVRVLVLWLVGGV